MDTRNQLTQEALQLGTQHKHREIEAQKRQDALRLEVQQQEAIADGARLCFERSLNFGKTLGADLLCPWCWVAQGEKTPIVPVPSERGDLDLFKCRGCDREYEFPV